MDQGATSHAEQGRREGDDRRQADERGDENDRDLASALALGAAQSESHQPIAIGGEADRDSDAEEADALIAKTAQASVCFEKGAGAEDEKQERRAGAERMDDRKRARALPRQPDREIDRHRRAQRRQRHGSRADALGQDQAEGEEPDDHDEGRELLRARRRAGPSQEKRRKRDARQEGRRDGEGEQQARRHRPTVSSVYRQFNEICL